MHVSVRWSLVSVSLAAGLAFVQTAAAQDSGSGVHWRQAPSVDLGGVFHGTVHAEAQLIGHGFPPSVQPAGTAPLELHRARVGLDGSWTPTVSFQVERELRSSDAAWRDAYVNVRSSRWLQVRVGQFKMPFSLDQLTSSQDRSFVYRSIAGTYLAPGRDVGAMVHGRSGTRVAYNVGVFRRGGENVRASERTAPQTDRTVAVRVVLTPFGQGRGGARSWSLGASTTTSRLPEGFNSVRGKTFGERAVLPVLAVSGLRHRYGLESRWSPGALVLQAETIAAIDERRHQGLDNRTLPPVVVHGFYASATWQRRRRASETPSLAVAARWEGLQMTGDRSPTASLSPRAATPPDTRLRAVTVGASWAPTPFTRLQIDLIHERSASAAIPGTTVTWSPVVAWHMGF